MNDLLHSFPGQEQNEPVFIFARPYFAAFLPTAAIFLFIILFSLLGQLAVITDAVFGFSTDTGNALILIFGVLQLFSVTVFMIATLDFYDDIVVVTDRRLVDIDQEQLFFRRISELSLEEIEDVTSIVQGFWQTTFNYGTVAVETAGREERFNIENIRFPREMTALILNLSQQVKQGIPEGSRVPETAVMGLINNQPLTSLSALQAAGATPPPAAPASPVPPNAP